MEGVKKYYDSPVSLADAEQYIAASFMTTAREYVAIGYWLGRIRDDKLFLEEGYKNFEEYVRHKYHRDPGWASNCIKVNRKFSINGNTPYLAEQYRDYNKSQLVELAYMTEEQRMEAGPDMSVKAMKEMRKQEQAESEKVVTSQLSDQASSAQEPTNQSAEKIVTSQPSERIVLHFTDGDLSIDNAYGAMIAEIVKAYLAEGYASLEKECEVTALGWTYKALKRPEVTVFYTEAGETFFDVENTRLEKEYQYWHGNRKDAAIKQQNEENAAKAQQEKLSPIERGCITGLSPHGNCVCCGSDGVKCCGQCDEDCNGRCGWIERPVKVIENEEHKLLEEEKLPDESWNIGELPQAKEKHLKQLAKKLVERLGSKIVLDEMSSIPSEETIEKATRQLGRMEPGGIELQDGAVAYACQGIIEFFRGEEDLGVCSYARFATQARKALSEWSDQVPGEGQEAEPEEDEQKPEVIDAEFSEVNELGDENPTDLQIAQRELERANRLLEKCLRGIPDETNVHIRGMRIKADALIAYIREMENNLNPPQKPVQPELPLLKNNDQRAAFVDAYETWPIWIETEETGERYYRYDLLDGTSMVVKVYHAKLFDYSMTDRPWEERFTDGYGCHEYYLLKPDKFFWDCKTNRSVLIDKLKEIQKKG